MQQLREAFGKLLVLYELSGSISYLKRLNRGHFQSEFDYSAWLQSCLFKQCDTTHWKSSAPLCYLLEKVACYL